LRIIKKKTLDDISKKIGRIEIDVSEQEIEKLGNVEKEKLQRFDLYHLVRLEKYVRQGGNPEWGNLDAVELTAEEFEYHLSHVLADYNPEERYRQRKDAYYFHPSFIRIDELKDWKIRANANYCSGTKCVQECLYYKEKGRIEDDEVISEWIADVEIMEMDDYRRELSDIIVDSILGLCDT
jgi:hypothetical protein